MTLLLAAAVLFGITLVFATLLGIAKEKLRVEEDPRIPAVTEAMGAHYPELKDKEDFSARIVQREEERFDSTLRRKFRCCACDELLLSVLSRRTLDPLPGLAAMHRRSDRPGCP